MLRYEQLLLENKAWAKEIKENDPAFFERLADGQQPKILWIGCSDSRVSPDDICQARPGEIFTHRNIANMVLHTDLNLFSVIQYAVEVLQVTDIVVCGHYECGGVKAALGRDSLGPIDKWIRNIKDVYRLHKAEVDALPEDKKVNRLVELNVREQLHNLASTAVVQKSWKNRQRPYLHGWVFDLHDGILKQVADLAPGQFSGDEIYHYANLD